MKRFFTILLLLLITVSFKAYGTTKEDIIKLTEAKTREEVIITHLKAQVSLILTPEDIAELEKAGVGSKVISFLKENNGDMTRFYNPPYRPDYFDGWKYGMYNYWYWPICPPWYSPWYGPCHPVNTCPCPNPNPCPNPVPCPPNPGPK